MATLHFEALQARFGDCLLITIPDPAPGATRPIRLLVDGGPPRVFEGALSKRLIEEQQAGAGDGFDDDKPVELDAIMVSHIDDDHVVGLVELLDAQLEARQKNRPELIRARFLIHNSFDALLGEGEGTASRQLGGATILAGLGGDLVADLARHDPAYVLQSYAKGSKLASLAAALEIERNPPDRSVYFFDPAAPRMVQMGDAKIAIVGPHKAEIDKLQEEWLAWRKEADDKKKKKEGLQSLAAIVDRSVPNLSSIVALLAWKGRKILLTGDARGDTIVKGLEQGGFLGAQPFKIDLLKMPHHGSISNVDLAFFQAIHADHYVMSGDGTFGNPDRATLELLEQARPTGGFTVHITYPATECDITHEAWKKPRKGKPFKTATHAIEPVISRWKAEGKIKVKEGPVSIKFNV